MRLINIKTVKKAVIFGGLSDMYFAIKATPCEFELLKETGVLVEDISVYDTFISIICRVNSERTQDLILKAQDLGIQVKYFCLVKKEGGKK